MPNATKLFLLIALTPRASIGVTPAMAAGVSDHIWTIEEIVKLAP